MGRMATKIGVLVVTAAIGIAAMAVILGTRPGDDTTTTARQAQAPDTTAKEVATSFVEAYGALDVERAITYLAEDADISELIGSVGAPDVAGTLDEFRLLLSLLDAQGYKQWLHSCEEMAGSAAGTMLQCPFDFQDIRSDELALGPFSGSYFLLTVRDGEIVQASKTWATEKFSPQVWEPFASWVTERYPKDAAIMYGGSGARLTEESVRLWEKRSREYAKAEIAKITPWLNTQL